MSASKSQDIKPKGVTLYDPLDYKTTRANVYDLSLKALQKKFPYSYGGVRMELNNAYYADPEYYGIDVQKEALMTNKFLNRRIRGEVTLVNESDGKVLDKKELTLMRVPFLTDRGTVIHNGSEYSILSQARLRPGVYNRRKATGELETQFNVKHGTGRAFRVRFEPETSLYKMDIGTSAKLNLYPILKRTGVTDEQMKEAWGEDIWKANAAMDNDDTVLKAHKHILGKKAKAMDTKDKFDELREALLNSKVEQDVVNETLPDYYKFYKKAAVAPFSDSKFGCLMLSLGLDDSEAVLNFAEANILKENLVSEGIEKYAHITLIYGFSEDFDFEQLRDLFAAFPQIKVTLGRVSKFRNEENDVLKIDVFSETLNTINTYLRQKYNIITSFDSYKPHITLGYVRKGTHEELIGNDTFEGKEITLNEYVYSTPDQQLKTKFIVFEGKCFSKEASLPSCEDDKMEEKFASTYAVGIPDKSEFGDLNTLPEGTPVPMVLHKHQAHRAGEHYDLRFGDKGLHSWALRYFPRERGKKNLAVQQPLHSQDYLDFEGEIPEGYGAGQVDIAEKGSVVITSKSPDKITFVTAHRKQPERFTLVKTQDKKWILLNRTPEVPSDVIEDTTAFQKVHLRVAKPEQLKSLIKDAIVQAKIDGASNLFRLGRDGIEVASYRVGKKGNPIVHTERFFDGKNPKFSIPKEYEGLILKGEVFGEKSASVIPASQLSGILNSTLENSLKQQRDNKIKLKAALFDIHGFKGTPQERIAILENVLKFLPKDKFILPTTARTPEEATTLYNDILTKRNPLTDEGVVVYPNDGSVPIKIKNYNEEDVFITGFQNGYGRLKDSVGGFYFATEKDGKPIGVIGSGLDDDLRKLMRLDPDEFIGRRARIKFMKKLPSGKYFQPTFISLHEDY